MEADVKAAERSAVALIDSHKPEAPNRKLKKKKNKKKTNGKKTNGTSGKNTLDRYDKTLDYYRPGYRLDYYRYYQLLSLDYYRYCRVYLPLKASIRNQPSL